MRDAAVAGTPGSELASMKVTLSGDDAEYWAGNYGSQFQGMHLYVSAPGGALKLARAHTTTTKSKKNTGFNTGFMAGFGATTAVCGLAAYAMYKRKTTAVEDGAYLRV